MNVTLQTVGTYGSGNHPSWVSYLVQSPEGHGSTRRSSRCPQHARINVTIYQYDSGSPLRNQQLGQVTGTYGNVATLNGKPFRVINPTPATASPTRSPCHPSASTCRLYGEQRQRQPLRRRTLHDELTAQCDPFLLHHPRARELSLAVLRPVRPRLLYGNGGPMSTLGYMGGFMKVVA